MATSLHDAGTCPVFRSTAEVEAFFLRIEPFVDARKVQAVVMAGPSLSRLGSFQHLTEAAGAADAVRDILVEIEREGFGQAGRVPHLVVFPNGWVALLRHLDVEATGEEAAIRIAICPAEAADADRICRALAQVLLGVQDGVGAKPGSSPLRSRREAPWPPDLAGILARDTVETAYRDLVAKRETEGEARLRRSRSNLTDQHLRWFASHRPPRIAPTGRGGGPAAARSPTAAVDLRHHIINMRFGELSDDGQFQTSPSDVAAIADRAKAWIDGGAGRRLAIYAHGGLVGERSAIDYASATAGWWLANDVYPIFCVWESDAVTTILQLIGETLGVTRGRGIVDELRDAAVERLVHGLGTSVWDAMKRSAQRTSADGDSHGLTLFCREVKRAFPGAAPPLDLVGHSAGSILLLHLLPRLKQVGLTPRTFQTLAPAATSRLYREGLAAFAGSGLRCRIYTMTDRQERDDTVQGIYGKSLLYLVSRGFEKTFGEPISGLQKDLAPDRQLMAQLTDWAGGVTREALVLSPTPSGTPRRLSSASTTHGGFDNDEATMWSVMHFIRGPEEADQIQPFPKEAADRGRSAATAEFTLPEEVRTYIAVARSTPAPAGTTAPAAAAAPPAVARMPARLALTIGINEYTHAKRLEGCVNDSDAWRDMLGARGFAVTQHARPEETGRDQIVQHLRGFVARSAPGDTLVWHFSGHGLEIEPEHGSDDDFETSGFDQALVASNASEGLAAQVAHAIVDDEIHSILQGLNPQASLYVFLDSCFSGSATRLALSGRPRAMGTVRRAGYVPRHRSLTAPSGGARGPYDGANHVLFSAASATQVAMEDGFPCHGAFTRAVGELLRSQSGPISNAEFRTRINALMPGNDQTSGLHCDPGRVNQPFPLIGN